MILGRSVAGPCGYQHDECELPLRSRRIPVIVLTICCKSTATWEGDNARATSWFVTTTSGIGRVATARKTQSHTNHSRRLEALDSVPSGQFQMADNYMHVSLSGKGRVCQPAQVCRHKTRHWWQCGTIRKSGYPLLFQRCGSRSGNQQ